MNSTLLLKDILLEGEHRDILIEAKVFLKLVR